jgi:hypothetical protein
MGENSSIVKAVNDLINKARGYESSNPGKASGKEAEAVDHSIPTSAPKADENEKETNKANSGTHPEAGGKGRKSVSGSRPEGGEDFPDGGAAEDEIKGSSGPSGRAPQGRPGTLKHEGGGTGPDHPGTATSKQSQQKSEGDSDLQKAEIEVETDSEEKEEDDKKEEEKDDAEKSSESGEVYLDVDEFAAEITKSVTENVLKAIKSELEPLLSKSNESEYVEAGLTKSVLAVVERVEEIEKAVVNISKSMNIRKSLINKSELSGVKRSALEGGTSLSKSEIASKLVDLQFKGDQEVNTPFVVRFESMPIEQGIEMLTPSLKSKLGIE